MKFNALLHSVLLDVGPRCALSFIRCVANVYLVCVLVMTSCSCRSVAGEASTDKFLQCCCENTNGFLQVLIGIIFCGGCSHGAKRSSLTLNAGVLFRCFWNKVLCEALFSVVRSKGCPRTDSGQGHKSRKKKCLSNAKNNRRRECFAPHHTLKV